MSNSAKTCVPSTGSTKINTCPYCGAPAAIFHTPEGWVALCSRDGHRKVISAKKPDAIAIWNEPKTSH